MPATLHLLSGKIASGKSTLAAELATAPRTVLISEDAWLSTLFGDQMTSIPDYLRCAAKLREVMAPHVVALLKTGSSVVLDFPANTVETRRWMRAVIDAAGVDHVLHLLDMPDALCLERMKARNTAGDHPFTVTEYQFHQITRAYEPPSPEEGFTILRHEVPG